MKEIKAYIKPHKLPDITLALQQVPGLTGMSATNIRGFGRGRAVGSAGRIMERAVGYVPCVKLEIVCHDDLVDEVVSLIQRTAHTGLRGDGKIYVSPVDTAVRISTGERGEQAV